MEKPTQVHVIFGIVELAIIIINLCIYISLVSYVLIKRRGLHTSRVFVIQFSFTTLDQLLNVLVVIDRTWIGTTGPYAIQYQLILDFRDFIFQLSQWFFVYQYFKVSLLMPLLFVGYVKSTSSD